ncbi:hypothetical protein C3D72_14405 [Cronobacter sakazakii]|nr:hypothetical protein C3D72_14405 [Cronobacter sakazakii]
MGCRVCGALPFHRRVSKRSAPTVFPPGHNTDGKVDGFTPAKKNRPIKGRFPPGAGIAKGAAASPLCTFA